MNKNNWHKNVAVDFDFMSRVQKMEKRNLRKFDSYIVSCFVSPAPGTFHPSFDRNGISIFQPRGSKNKITHLHFTTRRFINCVRSSKIMSREFPIKINFIKRGFCLLYSLYLICKASAQQYSAQFQFVGGTRSINHPGVYGEKGARSSQNFPGGRFMHSMCVNSINGKLLVWGGLVMQNGWGGMSFKFQLDQSD